MSHAITHASAIPNVPAGSGQILPAPLGALLRGPALAGYAVIGGFALVMAAWAILAPLSSSAIATGVVSPDGARRTVQHLEGGIVSRILVKDGDHVSAGQVLIEMDSTGAGAVNEALQNQIFEAEAAEARLEAEISGAETLIFPAVLQETAALRDAAAKALAVQQNIFDVRRQAELKKRAILRSRIAQIEEQIAGLRTERVALNRQAALVADRVTALQTLLTKGLVAKSSVIELQSHAAGLEGAIGQNAAAIAGAEQAMGEAELEQEAAEIARLDEINGRLAATRSALSELRERGKASADIVNRTRIVAPAAGRVMDLMIKTPGGVIGRGERILDIVPDSPDLIIEARVEPADIDDVTEGMTAQVLFSAFNDQRNMPHIDGIVRSVAADASADARTGARYYAVRIEVPEAERAKLPSGERVVAGMPVQIYIATGERSVFGYLFDPILETFRNAAREK